MKKKLKIGLDLDNTLLKTNLVNLSAKELKINYSDTKIRDWYFTGCPIKLKYLIEKRFKDPYYMCNLAQPIKGCKSKLQEWFEFGHTLILITARSPSIRIGTKEFVEKHFPQIEKIRFVGVGKRKRQLFKQEKLDVWIDDSPHDTKISLELGIKTFLISNNKTTYNWEARNFEGIKVVKSISSIEL